LFCKEEISLYLHISRRGGGWELEDIRDFWIRSGGGREKYTLKSEHRLLLGGEGGDGR